MSHYWIVDADPGPMPEIADALCAGLICHPAECGARQIKHEACLASLSSGSENCKLYHKSAAVTHYKNFPGRTHNTLGQDGWEEVAG